MSRAQPRRAEDAAIRNDRRNGRKLLDRSSEDRIAFRLVPRSARHNSHHRQSEPNQRAKMALNLFRGKWRIEILVLLLNGPVRLSQLRKRIPGATKKMLVQRLREMERDGIITRTDLSGKTKRVEYRVCDPVGIALVDLLVFLAEWSTHHLPASILNDGIAPALRPRPAIAPGPAPSSGYRCDSQLSTSKPFPVRRAELQRVRGSA